MIISRGLYRKAITYTPKKFIGHCDCLLSGSRSQSWSRDKAKKKNENKKLFLWSALAFVTSLTLLRSHLGFLHARSNFFAKYGIQNTALVWIEMTWNTNHMANKTCPRTNSPRNKASWQTYRDGKKLEESLQTQLKLESRLPRSREGCNQSWISKNKFQLLKMLLLRNGTQLVILPLWQLSLYIFAV